MRHSILVIPLALALVACNPPGTPKIPVEVSQTVHADTGGTIEHPSGARLIIPPGALDRDAVVKIKDLGVPLPDAQKPLVPASHRFAFDLGDAQLEKPVNLWLRYPKEMGEAGVVRTDHLLLETQDSDGNPWLRRVENPTVDGDRLWIGRSLESLVSQVSSMEEGENWSSWFGLVYVAPLYELLIPVLDVPYYWQDNLPWCAPTSQTMVVNYHDGGVGGIVSNTYLAGKHQQDAGEGAWPHAIMADAGVPRRNYDYYRWDADTIPGGAFTSYVKRYLNGFNLSDIYGPIFDLFGSSWSLDDVRVPPRPLELASTTTNHAFVAVGADDNGIWLHDSSGAFTGTPGIALNNTWTRFRQVAIDTTRSDELYTLVLNTDPRPSSQRRGSIVLYEGTNDSSLVWRNVQDYPVASYRWDGDPYPRGYYWTVLAGNMPVDDEFGIAFARDNGVLAGSFAYELRVANVSGAARDFSLKVMIADDAGRTITHASTTLANLSARSWRGNQNLVQGTLPTGSINAPGIYWIQFWLYQDGVLQDVKLVGFRVL